MELQKESKKEKYMDTADKWHISIGMFLATFSYLLLSYEAPVWVSAATVFILSVYIVLIFIKCALRSKDGNNKSLFELPNRTWALLLVVLFVITNVFSFSNMYLKSEGVINQIVEPKEVMESIPDAVYFSLVTVTTLGYGDFIPNEQGRIFVIFQLATGLLILLIIIPVVASRVTTW